MPGLKRRSIVQVPAQHTVLISGEGIRTQHDFMDTILHIFQPRTCYMLPDPLYVQMSADIKRYLIRLQQCRHLRPVLHFTLSCEQAAFLEQIVVSQHDHLNIMFLCHPEMDFHPFECCLADTPFHMISVIINTGIQHQKPVLCIQRIHIAQGCHIPVRRLVIPKPVIDLIKVISRFQILCLFPFFTKIGGCVLIPDIMVAGNHQHRNACILNLLQLLSQQFMVDPLTI